MRYVLACALLLAMLGCQNKAEMEAEKAKAKNQAMISFCKNMAKYREQDVSDNILLTEAAALGFNVENALGTLTAGHGTGNLAIVVQQTGTLLEESGIDVDGQLAGTPEGLYISGCLDGLDLFKENLKML